MEESLNKSVSKNVIFAALLIGSIVTAFLQTALTTALPAIMSDFTVSAAIGQWLTSGYSLAMGIMIPVSPFILRRFKTKTVTLWVVGATVIGVLLAAIATNFTMLLLGRIIQGLASGVMMALVQIVILTIYPIEKRGSMMGIYGLAGSAAPVIAPTIAGILIGISGWRIIFVIGLIVLVGDFFLLMFVMRNVLPSEMQKFDAVSMILCATGFSGILIGSGNIGGYAFFSAQVGLPLFIGIVALYVFVKKQLKMENPFIELRVFENKVFKLAVVMSMLTYFTLIASSTLFPMYLQIVHGFSATVCGLLMMPGSLISALMSPFSGNIFDRFGIRTLAVIGSLLSSISFLGLTFLTENTSSVYIIIVFCVQMVGIGCILMTLVTWGMSTLEVQQISDGTATLNTLRTMAGALGSALLVALMAYVTKSTSDSVDVVANVMGMRVTYVVIFVISVVQLVIAFRYVGKED